MIKQKILVVDDVELNREIITDILEDSFEILQAENGKEAFDILLENSGSIAAVLTDIAMPVMDGLEFMRLANKSGYTDRIPFIVISSETAGEVQRRCNEYGATDYIAKPFNHYAVVNRVKNAAELYSYKNHLEEKIEKQTRKIRRQNNHLIQLNNKTIEFVGNMIEARNLESGLHIRRVRMYTEVIAKYMMKNFPEYGLTREKVAVIVDASALHDFGKIMISDAVLLKPGKLTPDEYKAMSRHSVYGEMLLNRAEGLWDRERMEECRNIARWHHERWDGGGYPDGLRGDEIPISAQIVSLADVYDALVSDRVYKKAFPKDVAYEMIMDNKCGVFSDKLKQALTGCRGKMEKIADSIKESASDWTFAEKGV